MMRGKRVAVVCLVALLAVTAAQAVTQLYVETTYFRYLGHWAFNTASGAEVTVRVQNRTGTSQPVRVEFSARTVDGVPSTVGAVATGSLGPNETRDFRLVLSEPITSLHFLRIRRLI
jgi:hypothetical protein